MNKKRLMELALAALNAMKALQDPEGKKHKEGFNSDDLAVLQADFDAKKKAFDDEEAAKGKDAGKDDAKNVVTLDELKGIIETSVKTAIKDHVPEAKGLTADQVKEAVTAALNAKVAGDAEVNKANVNALVSDVLNEAVKNLRKESNKAAGGDAGDAARGNVIEIPFGYTKGNLPLHAKQLLNVCMQKPMNDGISQDQLSKGVQIAEREVAQTRARAKALRAGMKAMTSTGTNAGDELVPRDLSGELQRRLYLDSQLAALYAAREIAMPSQPYDLPLVTDAVNFYLETTEATEATAGTVPTGNITLDAKKLMGRVDYTYELDEDAIVPILPMITDGLSKGAARSWEDAIINGDTTATHMDSDYQLVAKHPARACLGLRKLALNVAALKKDLSSGGISEANLRAMRKATGKYGMRKQDCIWLVGSMGENDMQAIANLSTVDKAGAAATILTGELTTCLGVGIIVSEKVRETLNASGVYDNVTTTKGSIFYLNYTRFLVGTRREFMVEAFRDVKSQQNNIIASFRRAFVPIETPSATVPAVVLGYNYNA